ncbi:recombination protein RecO [Campylobacter hepaticus]|uniref:Recombination protein RecO n=1 Tax=Campylobacter hepaticus TaxID=1813019 RepID=A0A424Z0V9_9BACT|nr:recombination protein RecO [Campylobacter hepaticus]AXP09143.1 recombination protein RecO [Campylobacter hepaticus]MCZ0771636.1 recombination protein RecO [Campylobacter hepaticus]MCZ0773104.1 recombination protein RecO [Campylobacter hepaticus]MCZ0775784.1 recombination protein RecO [Campylobacter hepaticus]MDX2323437.1 recombination protein RecO [Campylobacter hepaticus]
MQGFILYTQKVKDEDLIVYVLSSRMLIKAYRFYGLRHSNILSGYKIDFALEENPAFLPRLKDVLHLGFLWIMQRDKMLIWQEFIRLLYQHLKEVQELDSFYFNLLDECVKRFQKQNPKRVIVDAYLKILEFEGRLHKEFICFACDEKIHNRITLIRALLPSHAYCALGFEFEAKKLMEFYKSKNCAIFNDEEIQNLYHLIKEGL